MEFKWWTLLAGIGAFLFGMRLMEQGLRSIAGRGFKLFVRRSSSTIPRSLISGAMVTAALQSSSMVSLMVMSLASAGIIGLHAGIGLLLGANVGTTATGWLIASLGLNFDLETLAYPLMAIGGLTSLFARDGKRRAILSMAFGLGLMFAGIGLMRESFLDMADQAFRLSFDGKSSFWFILLGAILAAMLHSSSTTVALALTSLSTGIISLEPSMLLVIGADMGTTATAAIATIKANTIKQRVGWSQVSFNLFSAALAWLMLPLYMRGADAVSSYLNDPLTLTAFHTSMNIVGVAAFLPLLSLFVRLMIRLVPEGKNGLSVNLQNVDPNESNTAIDALHAESHKFFIRTISLLRHYFNIVDGTPSQHVRSYADLKNYENEIVLFGMKVLSNPLSNQEAIALNTSLSAIRNTAIAAKSIKDVAHNLDELRASASDDLYGFYQTVASCQKEFYNNLEEVFQMHGIDRQESMNRLSAIAADAHRLAAQDVYVLYSNKTHQEIAVPSLLNLVRSINNSNESLLQAINPDLAFVDTH